MIVVEDCVETRSGDLQCDVYKHLADAKTNFLCGRVVNKDVPPFLPKNIKNRAQEERRTRTLSSYLHNSNVLDNISSIHLNETDCQVNEDNSLDESCSARGDVCMSCKVNDSSNVQVNVIPGTKLKETYNVDEECMDKLECANSNNGGTSETNNKSNCFTNHASQENNLNRKYVRNDNNSVEMQTKKKQEEQEEQPCQPSQYVDTHEVSDDCSGKTDRLSMLTMQIKVELCSLRAVRQKYDECWRHSFSYFTNSLEGKLKSINTKETKGSTKFNFTKGNRYDKSNYFLDSNDHMYNERNLMNMSNNKIPELLEMCHAKILSCWQTSSTNNQNKYLEDGNGAIHNAKNSASVTTENEMLSKVRKNRVETAQLTWMLLQACGEEKCWKWENGTSLFADLFDVTDRESSSINTTFNKRLHSSVKELETHGANKCDVVIDTKCNNSKETKDNHLCWINGTSERLQVNGDKSEEDVVMTSLPPALPIAVQLEQFNRFNDYVRLSMIESIAHGNTADKVLPGYSRANKNLSKQHHINTMSPSSSPIFSSSECSECSSSESETTLSVASSENISSTYVSSDEDDGDYDDSESSKSMTSTCGTKHLSSSYVSFAADTAANNLVNKYKGENNRSSCNNNNKNKSINNSHDKQNELLEKCEDENKVMTVNDRKNNISDKLSGVYDCINMKTSSDQTSALQKISRRLHQILLHRQQQQQQKKKEQQKKKQSQANGMIKSKGKQTVNYLKNWHLSHGASTETHTEQLPERGSKSFDDANSAAPLLQEQTLPWLEHTSTKLNSFCSSPTASESSSQICSMTDLNANLQQYDKLDNQTKYIGTATRQNEANILVEPESKQTDDNTSHNRKSNINAKNNEETMEVPASKSSSSSSLLFAKDPAGNKEEKPNRLADSVVKRSDENNNNNDVFSRKGSKVAHTRTLHESESRNNAIDSKGNNNTDIGNDDANEGDDDDENSAIVFHHSKHINDKHEKGAVHKEKMSISSRISEVNDDTDLKRRSWPLDPSAWEMYLRRMLNENSNLNLESMEDGNVESLLRSLSTSSPIKLTGADTSFEMQHDNIVLNSENKRSFHTLQENYMCDDMNELSGSMYATSSIQRLQRKNSRRRHRHRHHHYYDDDTIDQEHFPEIYHNNSNLYENDDEEVKHCNTTTKVNDNNNSNTVAVHKVKHANSNKKEYEEEEMIEKANKVNSAKTTGNSQADNTEKLQPLHSIEIGRSKNCKDKRSKLRQKKNFLSRLFTCTL